MKKLTLKELNELNKLNSLNKLLKVIELLRHPKNGCPWDIAQTFETLSNFPIEEAYELQNAINNKDIKNIKEELGDLLLQVVLFSQVSKDNNMFSFEEVCNEITKKIIRRHPQIFDINYNHNDTPKDTWEKIKLKEKKIDARIHYPIPIYRQPLYQKEYKNFSLPITDLVAKQQISLPIFPGMKEHEIKAVTKCLKNILDDL